MSGFVDIHAHVLPEIDDGPPDLDGTLELCRAAANAGTATLVATPHLRSDFAAVRVTELADRCARVRDAVGMAGIDVELIVGAEASLVWALEASDEELRLATYGQRGTDLLIETPSSPSPMLPELLYQVRVRGYRVTMAHPERSFRFQREVSLLEDLVRQGVLLQVNADALVTVRRGAPVRRLAERLCRDGLAHALASDGHRAGTWRPVTSLAEGVEAAAVLVGRERAEWMAREAPAAIVAGAEVGEGPPVRRSSRRWWLLR